MTVQGMMTFAQLADMFPERRAEYMRYHEERIRLDRPVPQKVGTECTRCLGEGWYWGDDDGSPENNWEWDGMKLECPYTNSNVYCKDGIIVEAE